MSSFQTLKKINFWIKEDSNSSKESLKVKQGYSLQGLQRGQH